jgi:hypothetical protein
MNPEDRGPSSLRVSNYDPSNPIHKGLVSRQHIKSGEPVNKHIDARIDKITMPVAPGMESEPKLSGRHMTNEENTGYVVPTKNRIKLPEPKKNAEIRRSAIRKVEAKKVGGFSAFLKNQNNPK